MRKLTESTLVLNISPIIQKENTSVYALKRRLYNKMIYSKEIIVLGGPGGTLPFQRLIGRYAAGWGRIFTTGLTIMGLHFQKSYQNGAAHFRIFGVRELFIFTVSKRTRIFVLQVKSKVFFIQFIKKWVNSFFDDLFKGLIRQINKQKVTKLGSQKLNICPRVTNMGSRGSERPAAHTQQKLPHVTPRGAPRFR